MGRRELVIDRDSAAGRPYRNRFTGFGLLLSLLLVIPAGTSRAQDGCDPIADMFCVSQRVFTHSRDGESEAVSQMFVYRFHEGTRVDIAHGNPPVTTSEDLLCVDGRTYRGLMLYDFSDDWRQGVAAFIDPGMSTVEFLECAPED